MQPLPRSIRQTGTSHVGERGIRSDFQEEFESHAVQRLNAHLKLHGLADMIAPVAGRSDFIGSSRSDEIRHQRDTRRCVGDSRRSFLEVQQYGLDQR